MSHYRLPIATHPITEPVETLEQAQRALESDAAWFGFSDPRNVSVQPGGSELGLDRERWAEEATARRVERMALLMWHDRQQWKDEPELGLVPALNVVGFKATYYFNGPDSNATLGCSELVCVPGLTPLQERLAKEAFQEVLATRWNIEDKTSPMRGLLHVLANRKPQHTQVDLSSLERLRSSLMLPEQAAQWRARLLDNALGDEPCPAASRGPRL